MFAINHAATALVIKKVYPDVPLIWILISVQFMELIWVLLNYLGIERTTTENKVTYVGDVHLAFMPYSHSVATMGGAAILAWLVIGKGLGQPDIGAAVGIGIGSHLFLDLITHSRDIALVPALEGPKLGLGLYENLPVPAFILEIGYGAFCWWVYQGSAVLLTAVIAFNVANLSMFVRSVPGIERRLASRPRLIATVILVQIVVTLVIVGLLS
jgi:hypothetical protein